MAEFGRRNLDNQYGRHGGKFIGRCTIFVSRPNFLRRTFPVAAAASIHRQTNAVYANLPVVGHLFRTCCVFSWKLGIGDGFTLIVDLQLTISPRVCPSVMRGVPSREYSQRIGESFSMRTRPLAIVFANIDSKIVGYLRGKSGYVTGSRLS